MSPDMDAQPCCQAGVTGRIIFSAAVPDSFAPVSCAQREPALIWKAKGAPTADSSWWMPKVRGCKQPHTCQVCSVPRREAGFTLSACDSYGGYLEIRVLTPIPFLSIQVRNMHSGPLGAHCGAPAVDYGSSCWIVAFPLTFPALVVLVDHLVFPSDSWIRIEQYFHQDSCCS